MAQGKVKTWMADRGFGFITGEDGEDVFAHVKSLPAHVKFLEQGALVRYDVKNTARGVQAVNVALLADGEPTFPDVLPESQFVRELRKVLPQFREEGIQSVLEWAREHGWVSD